MPLQLHIEDLPEMEPGSVAVAVVCVVLDAESVDDAINTVLDATDDAPFELYIGPTVTRK
jgi:hypothetical protein